MTKKLEPSPSERVMIAADYWNHVRKRYRDACAGRGRGSPFTAVAREYAEADQRLVEAIEECLNPRVIVLTGTND